MTEAICLFFENHINIPFEIKRTYWIYEVPGGCESEGHAHKELYQLIVAASGSFTISLDDGFGKKSFMLNNPNKGLLVVPGIWRELIDFSSGSLCLVLASMKNEATDFIRDYQEF